MALRKKNNILILMDKLYEEEIKKIFISWIKNYCQIDCFAILVILPDNKIFHLSTHPELTKIYHARKYGLYDQPVSRKLYEHLPFYPWRQPGQNRIQREIHDIREKIFNLNSGTNFVRKIDTDAGRFHIIYCVSSYDKDNMNYFKFACNVDKILQACDFCYNGLLPIFQENCDQFTLPKIKEFIGFQHHDISSLFNSYVIQKEVAERLISFIEQSTIDNVTEFNLKSALKLVTVNKQPHMSNNPRFVPYLIK